jgi:hypothetical protein
MSDLIFRAHVFVSVHNLFVPSRDSAVGIATGYGLDERGVGVRIPGGGKNFHLSMSCIPALGPTQPPIQWVPGALSPRGKAAGA